MKTSLVIFLIGTALLTELGRHIPRPICGAPPYVSGTNMECNRNQPR